MTNALIHQLEDCYKTVAHIEYPDDPYAQEIHDWLARGGIAGMMIRKRDIGQPFSRVQAFKFVNNLISDASRQEAPATIIAALKIERERIWSIL